jgi:pilus assembly protein Flp/PilA
MVLSFLLIRVFKVHVNALNWLKSLIERDVGVTAMAYGLMGSLIAVVIVGGVTTLGTELTNAVTII